MPRYCKKDITGKRYGMWEATAFVPDDTKHAKWLCKCDCGTEKLVMIQSLEKGGSLSCGCNAVKVRTDKTTKHGACRTGKRSGAYSSWANMMMRSEWGSHPSSKDYKDKGIRVDAKWHSFDAFLEDMGERPDGTSIDRIDGTKGYSKENCRWATRDEQVSNRSNVLRVVFEGKVYLVMDICEKFGISRNAFYSRTRRRNGDHVAAIKSYGVDVEPAI